MITLRDFVTESNLIEDIHTVTEGEIKAHENLLENPLTIESVSSFVWEVAGARLRSSPGMDVYVGDHRPPSGGERMIYRLQNLLDSVNNNDYVPWEAHCMYEDLHPFMDGNGRSGRAIWLKHMGGVRKAPLGFLHHFYYQTLQERRK